MGGGVKTGNGGQRQAGHDHTGHGSTLKRHGQSGCQTASGGLCGSNVGNNRYPHSDVACHKRSDSADKKADGGFDPQQCENQHKNDSASNRHAFELTIQVGNGPFLDGAGNLLHLLISGRSGFYNACQNDRKEHPGNTDQRTNQW